MALLEKYINDKLHQYYKYTKKANEKAIKLNKLLNQKKTINKYGGSFETIDTNITQINNYITNINTQIDKLQIDSINGYIDQIRAEINKLKEINPNDAEELKSLESEIENVKAEYDALNNAVNELVDKYTNYNTNLVIPPASLNIVTEPEERQEE